MKNQVLKIGLGVILGFGIASTSVYLNGSIGLFESKVPLFVGVIILNMFLMDVHAENESRRKRVGIHVGITGYRGLVLALFSIMLTRPWEDNWIETLWLFVFEWGLFAVHFDHFIAYYKDQKSMYLGGEAFFDRLFRKWPGLLSILDTILLTTGAIKFMETL